MPKFRLKRPPVVVARQLTNDNVLETCGWLEEFKLVVRHTEDLIIFTKDVPGAKAFYEVQPGMWIVLTIDPDGAALKMGVLGDATFHDKYELDLPSDEPVITYIEKAAV